MIVAENMSALDKDVLDASVEDVVIVHHNNELLDREFEEIFFFYDGCQDIFTDQAEDHVKNDLIDIMDGLVRD